MRVVDWLRTQGHDAIRLREEGLARLPNGEIFAKALRESRTVLTFDMDFGEIMALTHGRKTAVIVFRLKNTRASHVIERLSAVLSESGHAVTSGTVVAIEESRHRIRKFPDEHDTYDGTAS